MHEAPIRMVKPPSPQREPTPPPPPPPPQQPEEPEAEPEANKDRLPILVCGIGIKSVFPHEATRDVLSGRVDYYLVDDRGMTLFRRKHIFAALKLGKNRIERYEDYPCIGGHQRVFDRKPKERQGLGYRRRYLSPELVGRGIYVSL